MREILFRGKRIDNGEWVEGAYYNQNFYYGQPCIKHFIIVSDESLDNDYQLSYYEVIPETVGQYTGLTDKNGKRIFEGDICRIDEGQEYEWTAWVEMAKGCFVVMGENEWDFVKSNTKKCKAIGNIHDNPELLKGASNDLQGM